jgi:hypothetical protein
MLGWKKDLQEHILETDVAGPTYRSDRYGASRASLPSSCYDLMHFCRIRDQQQSSACVGFAVTGAVYCRLRSLGYDCGPFSPLTTYAVGRQLEGIYKNKPLPDEGSHPFLVMSGARRFGLAPESAWPFDSTYLERVTKEVPLDVFLKASQFRLSSFARIDATGQARVEACKHAIASGHPIPLGMEVGREFENYGPGKDPVGIEGDSLGGHMTFLCGYEDDGEVFIGCNSWGSSWGDKGFYRIHKSKLMDSTTSDLYDLIITDQKA